MDVPFIVLTMDKHGDVSRCVMALILEGYFKFRILGDTLNVWAKEGYSLDTPENVIQGKRMSLMMEETN